jgi:guanylate kinase
MARRSKSKAIARRGLMLVLSSPSGAGKTTLSRMLLTEERIALSISVTTRARRPGEVHGRHYHFIDRNRFDQLRKNGDLLEYAEVFGNF